MPSGLVFGCLLPHPPVLLPEVGGEMAREVQPTVQAIQEVARHIAEREPDTLVLMSPHGPLYRDRMAIGLAPEASGDFSGFQAPRVRLRVPCDVDLARRIQAAAERVVIPVAAADTLTSPGNDGSFYSLDHGAAVPLHFLLPFLEDVQVVILGFSYLPRATHLSFGQRIREACDGSGKRVVFVASGDLSHRLIPTAPAGYDPLGKVFDERIVSSLGRADWDGLAGLPEELVDAAGVCGYQPLLTLAGSLLRDVERSSVLSYQGPFGVGYAVAEMEPRLSPAQQAATAGRDSADGAIAGLTEQAPGGFVSNERARGSEPFEFEGVDFAQQILALARASLESYARQGRRLLLPPEQPATFQERRACFVTLRSEGRLRGCVGTILAAYPSLAHEVVENAIGAASRDYRFRPVLAAEVSDIACSVDVLTVPEPVIDRDMLDPARFGLVVKQGERVGVLLPGIPEITTVDEQYRVCLEKAGIATPESVEMYRFEVTRYAEPGAEH